MHKNRPPKSKTSSSLQSHDCDDEQNKPRVRYEIISRDIVVNNAKDTQENTKGISVSTGFESEGETNNVRQNETTLERFKRKFKKKGSKSSGKAKSTVDSMNGESGMNTRRSFPNHYRDQQEHIYEVPFTSSSVSEEGSDKDEHVYENGHIWAENNSGVRRGSTTRENNVKSDEVLENQASAASAGKYNLASPNSQMDNGSRKERWKQQGKSMSLPAPRVSAKPRRRFRPSKELNENHPSDNSGNEGGNGGAVEQLQANQHEHATNSSFNILMRSRSLPVPSKLDYDHQFLSGLNYLCKRGWYWGPLSSKEAEVMLRGKPDGTFLVRDSNDNRYLLSLSFRSEMRTLHTRIEFCKGKFSFYAAPFITSGSHVSIVDLIEDCIEKSKEKVFCYSKGRGNNGAAFPVRLMKPISRFEQVCTLQHLCRFVIRQHFTLENIGDMPLPGMMKRYLNKNHFDATKQG